MTDASPAAQDPYAGADAGERAAWNTACPDWQQRIIQGRSLLPSLPLNDKEASTAVRIFNLLRLPDVPGQPRMAEAAGDWFRDAVRALFGSYDPVLGIRHLRELFVLVPKKNSKTTNGAALMLTAVLMSRRPRAEFLLVAPTQEVSDLAFAQAVGMIEADEVLRAKCHIQSHVKRIVYRPTGAFLKVKSFDPRVVTGSKPAGVLLDEVHVIAQAHDADRVIGQLRGGLISQPEGFLVQITTQSERAPAGVFRAELMKARAVRDGRLDAPLLPMLYEFPPSVDWRNPINWPMVTPNNGRSITVERLITEYRSADAAGPEEMRRWASQHLNVEIGLALISDGWAGAEYWEDQGRKGTLTLDALLDRCELVVVGIDGGGLEDMLGLTALGRERDTGRWLSWSRAWLHPVAVDRRKQEAPRYADFERDGDLRIVRRMGDDVEEVAEVVRRVQSRRLLYGCGVDPVGIGAIPDALLAAGVPQDSIYRVPQGWRLAGAIKSVERRLAEGTMEHDGSALMNWCVGNAKVEPRGNAITITKQAAGNGKIDPLVALFNAAALMQENPQLKRAPTYKVFFA
jgi:phage terminase large subunit-like protein